MSDALIGEGAAIVAQTARASPVLTTFVREAVPLLVAWGRDVISRGTSDPKAELEALLAGVEAHADALAREKFGSD